MASMHHALRHCGLPCLVLWHAILPHKPALIVHERRLDMSKVVESRRNPTTRCLGLTRGVSVVWLQETCKGADLALAYEVSARVATDIYTKAFADPENGNWRAYLLACATLRSSMI